MEAGSLTARRDSSENYMSEDMRDGRASYGKPRVERSYSMEGGSDYDALVEESGGSHESHVLNGLQAGQFSPSGKAERWKWWKVYALHFLFMWNIRTYEYAAILLVALAFPNTLMGASIRGISSTVSAMLCASVVGSWIDRAPSRLLPLLISIFANHGAITISYLCWLLWHAIFDLTPEGSTDSTTTAGQICLFAFILLLDIIQDLSAIGNRMSLELGWVPVLVGPTASQTNYSLTQINAVMRRIDMICKLVAPTLIPLLVSNMGSHKAWIILLAGITILLWGLEAWCAIVIVRENPQLSHPKEHSDPVDSRLHDHQTKRSTLRGYSIACDLPCQGPFDRVKQYFAMSIWPASMALAMLQMTVLAYSATLITYLLEVGFSLTSVTIARGSGSIMALASTFITPLTVRYLLRRETQIETDDGRRKEDSHDRIVRRVGLWGMTSQFVCTLPVIVILWTLSRQLSIEWHEIEPPTPSTPHLVSSVALFAFLSLSRVGHWMFDLMVQELEQVEVPEIHRSTFAGTEQSFRALFELSHWGATIVWSRPQSFRWLALGSWVILAIAVVLFGTWSYSARSKKVPIEGEYEGVPMVDAESWEEE